MDPIENVDISESVYGSGSEQVEEGLCKIAMPSRQIFSSIFQCAACCKEYV